MDIVEETINFIKVLFKEEYSGHDFYHSIRVYNTAKKIAEIENADIFIVSLAALLHDVDDWKISPDTNESNSNAICFLKEKEVPADSIVKICEVINEVSFKGTDSIIPSTIEGKCVQDADRLDALGAIGIARTFAYGGNHNRPIYDPDSPPKTDMNGTEYKKHVSTSFNHFYEKILLLKDMMNTESARKIAFEREKFLKEYLKEFLLEWNGEDIKELH